jgi:hypothetical protein
MSERSSKRSGSPLWLRLLIAIPLGAVFGVLAILGLPDSQGTAAPFIGGGIALLIIVLLVRSSSSIGKLFSNFLGMLGGI